MEGATVISGWRESLGIDCGLDIKLFWLGAIVMFVTQLEQSSEA